MSRKFEKLADNVYLSDDAKSVVIIDQTKLPNEVVELTLSTAEEMYDAIKTLAVRGAPAIGICAGYSIYCLAQQIEAETFEEFYPLFKKASEYLNSSRPTAVNLSWALNRMDKLVCDNNRLTGTLDLNKFKALTSVACGGNGFTAINVAQCTALTSLSCANTMITALDTTSLKMLESLIANDCLITTMDCSNNRALKTLYLQGNPLTSLVLATGQTIADMKIDNYDVISYK